MKDHVPDLARCKRLRDKGFPQDMPFFWWSTLPWGEVDVVLDYADLRGSIIVAAPIVTELVGEIAKFEPGTNIEMGRYVLADGEDATWECSLDYEAVANADTLPNALADLWLWLRERGE